MFAYVGSRTTRARNARGAGISVYRLDEEQRRLTLVQVLGDLVNPSFLALNERGDCLYSVHGDEQEVSAFRVDRASGELMLLATQGCGGKNPVHLALDPAGRDLVVSNHLSGTVAVLPVLGDGSLGPVKQLVPLPGAPGPHRIEQPFSKPHFNPFDPSGRFIALPDKGLDRIFTFRFDDGHLSPTTPAHVEARECSGPRHITFHKNKPWAFAVNELDSTVTAYAFDSNAGTLKARQILSTLPQTYTGNSRASEIEIDPSQRFLYASNRGFDSIAVFAIDETTGLLSFIEAVPSQGRTPRYFTISPNGCTMFVLNEDSDSIITMARSAMTGKLTPIDDAISCGSPVCMVFSPES
ncbi:lactonase family protein [Variovorax humicola]|uniref:Lactonase family protein n=1 Tax=Variovorax humicola TaxID=1769758 RepID=A0ABU8VYM7_9BURK